MGQNNKKHIFGVVKVGEKGQVVIPKKAREIFQISAGDTLLVLGDEDQGGIALAKVDDIMEFAASILKAKDKEVDE